MWDIGCSIAKGIAAAARSEAAGWCIKGKKDKVMLG
jgi:hypothetical protein